MTSEFPLTSSLTIRQNGRAYTVGDALWGLQPLIEVVVLRGCRAERYFKRAVLAKPVDAEALDRYATFLWKVRNDLTTTEEAYQEAIAVDPGNSHHEAAYAHFLWNTGGEDTCYPLD
ncbi:hypothetical protein ABZP36_017422 [Zizania latifolia]